MLYLVIWGKFGTRNAFFPEASLMPWAAKIIGRPVKWISSRSEVSAIIKVET